MFDLNQNIENWRRELRGNPSMSQEDVDELVSHLQDEIENLTGRGLSEEEAFWVARRRLGDASALSVEFSKVNRAAIWRQRLLWLLTGYFLLTMVPQLVKLLTLPLYLLDLTGGFVTIHIMGTPVPIAFLVLGLLVAGSAFLLVVRLLADTSLKQKLSTFKPGYGLMWASVALYLVIVLGGFFSTNILAHKLSVWTMSHVAVSQTFFSFWWNTLLLACFVILIVTQMGRKNKPVVV